VLPRLTNSYVSKHKLLFAEVLGKTFPVIFVVS